MDCDFNNDAMTCPQCGYVASSKDIHRNCKKPLVTQAWSLITAETKWILAGMPKRTPKEVEDIFCKICQPCEHYQTQDTHNGTCGLCGCSLQQFGGMLNKIIMLTEKCPANKW